MRLRTLATVSVPLALGLLAGGLFVGRAGAQAPGAPPPAYGPPPGARFQYACYKDMPPKIWEQPMQQKLNEMGAQGWRLMENRQVTLVGNGHPDVYCFERRY
jgi:hypothetical protein